MTQHVDCVKGERHAALWARTRKLALNSDEGLCWLGAKGPHLAAWRMLTISRVKPSYRKRESLSGERAAKDLRTHAGDRVDAEHDLTAVT